MKKFQLTTTTTSAIFAGFFFFSNVVYGKNLRAELADALNGMVVSDHLAVQVNTHEASIGVSGSGNYVRMPPGYSGSCPSGYGVSHSECAAAGEELGGVAPGGTPVTGDWSHTPCGCFVENEAGSNVHFDTGSTCSSSDMRYELICKTGFVKIPPSTYTTCPSGYQVNQEECLLAGLAVGGTSQEVTVGSWSHTPCGCFVETALGLIHYDTGSSCSNGDSRYEVICTEGGFEKLDPTAASECSSPVSQDVCLLAGIEVGGQVLPGETGPLVGAWSHTPCGCFVEIGEGDGIHYDTGSNGCSSSDNRYQLVCN